MRNKTKKAIFIECDVIKNNDDEKAFNRRFKINKCVDIDKDNISQEIQKMKKYIESEQMELLDLKLYKGELKEILNDKPLKRYNDSTLTAEVISRMKLKDLQELVKKYYSNKYKSKLNKKELSNILITNLKNINMRILSEPFYNGLLEESGEGEFMSTLYKENFIDKGLKNEFELNFMREDDKQMKYLFNTIIYRNLDGYYKVATIKDTGGEIYFRDNEFKIGFFRRKYSWCFSLLYEEDINFKLNKEKGVLFIIGDIIKDSYFNDGSSYDGIKNKVYTYEEIKKLISNKEKFKYAKTVPHVERIKY